MSKYFKIDSLLKCLCDIEDGVSGCRRDERLCRRYHTPEIIKYFKTFKKLIGNLNRLITIHF